MPFTAQILNDGFDLNSLVKPGYYSVVNGLNAPDASNYVVDVRKANVGGNARVVQHATRTINNKVYTRVFTGLTGWTAWTALSGSGGGAFLDPADLIDDTDSVYFYFGWVSVAGTWLVRRQVRATTLTLDATGNTNAEPDLATAWANKENLIYA
jgi:hypothetical protein